MSVAMQTDIYRPFDSNRNSQSVLSTWRTSVEAITSGTMEYHYSNVCTNDEQFLEVVPYIFLRSPLTFRD